MATNAQVIFEAGMARATSNDPGKLVVDGEVLGRLNRVFQGLYALAARQRPMAFGSNVALALAGSPPSAALPTDVIDIQYLRNATGGKVHLIPQAEVSRTWHIPPSVYQLGLNLVSRALTGDPVAGETLTATVLDAPAALTTLTTNLDARFPVRHHEILVNDIALYCDAKDEGRNAAAFAKLQADQRLKLAEFAAEYSLASSVLEFVHSQSERTPAPVSGKAG